MQIMKKTCNKLSTENHLSILKQTSQVFRCKFLKDHLGYYCMENGLHTTRVETDKKFEGNDSHIQGMGRKT